MRTQAKMLAAVLLVTLSAGCSREKSAPPTDEASPDSQQAKSIVTGELAVPFEGTVKARQWLYAPINVADVTYWIAADKIRREVVAANVVDKIVGSPRKSGVICDFDAGEVTLYCAEGKKKHYHKMTLADYRKLAAGVTFRGHPSHYGFGILFVDMPPQGQYVVQNTPDAVAIDALDCDRLVINFGDLPLVMIESDHCHKIRVQRELLELVELNPPVELTGFPLRIRRAETIRQLRSPSAVPKSVAKAAKAISTGLEKALESAIEVTEIVANRLDDSAFRLPEDFTELSSIADFDAAFPKPDGGDLD